MSQTFIYEDSQFTWTEDLGQQAARLGDHGGYIMSAEAGQIGTSTFIIDDPDGTVGHAGDHILGLQNFYVTESDCATDGPDGVNGVRIYTGFTRERTYRRGDAGRPSLITGAERQITVALEDLNARLSFRLLQGEGVSRPAETDVERVQWLLSHPALATVNDDAGWVDTSNPVDMDAADYSLQTAADLLHDCAVASGKNYWVGFWGPTAAPCLWYADSNTSTMYSSLLRISNVLEDKDDVTTFAPVRDGELLRNPARTFAGIALADSTGFVYVYDSSTAAKYAYRDGTASNANISSSTTATAEANRELADAASEDDRVTCTVQLPSWLASGIKAGQRIQCKFSHLPGYETFTWFRVVDLKLAQDQQTDRRYTFGLTLSPQTPPPPDLPDLYGYYHGVSTGSGWGRDYGYQPLYLLAPGLAYSLIVGTVSASVPGDYVTPTYAIAGMAEIDRHYASGGSGARHLVALAECFATTDHNFDGSLSESSLAAACEIAQFVSATPFARVQYAQADGETVVLPGSPTAGNLLVMSIAVLLNPGTSNAIPDQVGWTPTDAEAHGWSTEQLHLRQFYKQAAGSGDTTTVVNAGGNANVITSIIEYSF